MDNWLRNGRHDSTSEPIRIPANTVEIVIIKTQKRIYYFVERMAKSVTMLKAADEPDEAPAQVS